MQVPALPPEAACEHKINPNRREEEEGRGRREEPSELTESLSKWGVQEEAMPEKPQADALLSAFLGGLDFP